MSDGAGFLAIWSDIAAPDETDYLHWLTREHVQERLSVPGFLGVRVFRARHAEVRRYFILYRLVEAGVVGSPAYLERLNAPTPWSSRIMPKLANFGRGGGTVRAEHGTGTGGAIVARRLVAAELVSAEQQLAGLAGADRAIAARLLEVDRGRTDIPTTEKSLRSAEGAFAGILLVEALDAAALTEVAARPGAEAYDQIFALSR